MHLSFESAFEYCESAPNKFLSIGQAGKIHTTGLYLYGLYRNTLYDSYKKTNLNEDILSSKKVFDDQNDSELHQDLLYHFIVAGSLTAIKKWLDPNEKLKSYFAYENCDGHKRIVGFVSFTEKLINENSVVYIAQAGVMNRSHSVGRRLMECILSHYPIDTHFNILTRAFNTEARTLYEKRLNFSPIGEEIVLQLGYNKYFCGFEHTTTEAEISEIKSRQTDYNPTATKVTSAEMKLTCSK